MIKAIQKICMHGNSANITLSRKLLFDLGLQPGKRVLVWTTPDGVAHFRPFVLRDDFDGASYGVIDEAPTMERK